MTVLFFPSGLPEPEVRGRQSAVFEISSVTTNDEGIYTCTATNDAGSVDEQIEIVMSNDLDPGPARGDVVRETSPDPGDLISIDNTDFKVPAGGRAQIRCSSKGLFNYKLFS